MVPPPTLYPDFPCYIHVYSLLHTDLKGSSAAFSYPFSGHFNKQFNDLCGVHVDLFT